MASNRTISTRLDRLAREICLARAGYRCEKCGSTEKLEWAHIIPRQGHKAIRWSPYNAMILCKTPCHVWFDRKASLRQRVQLIESIIPEAFDWQEGVHDGIHKGELKFEGGVPEMLEIEMELRMELEKLK